MSKVETTIRQSATPGEWTADWNDVLRRAGHSRSHSRRAAAVAVLAALAVVLLLPGIGIGGGLNAWISGTGRPVLQFRAELSRNGHLIGTVSARPTRLRGEFSWNADLSGAVRVSSLRILGRRGGVVVRLCAPCNDGARGTIRNGRVAFAAIFGRGIVVAETPQGAARGTLKLQKPVRR